MRDNNLIQTERHHINVPVDNLQPLNSSDNCNSMFASPTALHAIDPSRPSVETNRKRVGFILLITVVFLWGGSSFLLQKLFTFIKYSKPLLTTLIQTSLTSLLLLPKIYHRWKSNNVQLRDKAEIKTLSYIIQNNETPTTVDIKKLPSYTTLENAIEHPTSQLEELSIALLNDPEKIPTKKKNPSVLCSWSATVPLGFFWFGGQICFNLSLIYATVPTSIIVSSTSIFFTYGLMILFGERFDLWNFSAMLLSFFGVGLVVSNTPMHRNTSSVKDTPLGYTLSFISAVLYAFFVVCLKQWSSCECFKARLSPVTPSVLSTRGSRSQTAQSMSRRSLSLPILASQDEFSCTLATSDAQAATSRLIILPDLPDPYQFESLQYFNKNVEVNQQSDISEAEFVSCTSSDINSPRISSRPLCKNKSVSSHCATLFHDIQSEIQSSDGEHEEFSFVSPYSSNKSIGQNDVDYSLCLEENKSNSKKGELMTERNWILKTITDEEIEMTSLFGSIGFLIGCLAPFVILFAHLTSLESFEMPNRTALEWMLVNGLLGTMLSNYLWGLTVILLNPIVTTVGTNLQIPLVIIADSGLFNDHMYKLLYIIGSVLVIVGVIIVSIRTTSTTMTKNETNHDDF